MLAVAGWAVVPDRARIAAARWAVVIDLQP
jgi:hypothetical protein